MPDLPWRRNAGAGDTVEASRRRFARRQWARRWATWRGLVVLAVVGAVLAVAGWVVLASPVLDVRGVEVSGTTFLRPAQVRSAAAVPRSGPLARADLDAVRRRVEALPAVASVHVSRAWPHQVRIVVTERVAVAVVEDSAGLHGLDADGVTFRDFKGRPARLPLIRTSADTHADALQEAARVVGVLPQAVARRVAFVDVHTRDAISLELRDGRIVMWGSADQADAKSRVLGSLLKAVPDARAYDVSVPGQPTTRS
ncbi:cell division protein FtsQ/DivIB [Nocardioides jiangxiensis]|uniref:Cell division protein FtsQ n=1 Tax=Nocardioides jiangxiensis TaxID=3064524 RepID=A0ABT9B3F8_9ACTN|nr:FtsQ-type POTRA domain-containing protein [Nocardioides sp. WY-20]MDO7869349.1 FtsQ-type POTRA domain-containing protein [Nocardioides sp. WY-20]